MSTSDPSLDPAGSSTVVVPGAGAPDAVETLAGLPGAASLAAWANQLFHQGVTTFAALATPASAAAPFYFLDHARDAATPAFADPLPYRSDDPFGAGGTWPSSGAAPVTAPLEGSWFPALTRVEFPAPPRLQPSAQVLDVEAVRRDFPILSERVNGRPLVWLDNAATTQKPRVVVERISRFYEHENSNIHRGAHTLAARSTDAYEAARETVRRFVGASSVDEIVFVRGATEGINLVAQAWGRRNVREGDEIVISWLEHHSNIVPWQQLCAETGARLRVAPVDDSGQVLLDEYERLLGNRTRIVALTQVSNALGTVTPLREMIASAHRVGARTLVDAAQSIPHLRTDVQALDCDFLVFSGHKVFGPTGIGVVYGKAAELAAMPPWQGGGNMIADVTFEATSYHPAPARFEAGTGNIADAVGLGAALEYVERLGIERIARYEHELLEYGTHRLLEIPGLRLVGTARDKAAVLSFVLPGIPTAAVGQELARDGIAVRAGHHCAQPALRRFGLESTVRPSLALYNTRDEIDALVASLRRIQGGSSRFAWA